MEKLKMQDLRDRKDWKRAVVVFTKDSFANEYSEVERSYEISSDAKMFNNMCGSSLFGCCLDGKDNCVRLDWYMRGGGWKVDYCYIIE